MNTNQYTHTSRLLRQAVQIECRTKGVVTVERGTLCAEASDVVNELSRIAEALYLSVPDFDYHHDHDDEVEDLEIEILSMHCTDLIRVMELIGITGLATGTVKKLSICGE